MIFAALDWFIHKHAGLDDETRMRARLMVGLLLLNNVVLVFASIALLVYLLGQQSLFQLVAVSQLPMIFIYGGSLIYFCRTLNFRLSGNVFLAGQWVTVFAGVIFTGGITQSPILPMAVLVAEYAFLLLGLRGGLRWSFGVVAMLAILALIHVSGVQHEPLASTELRLLFHISTPVLLLFTSVLALVLYEVTTSHLRNLLAIERNQFAYQAAHDPLTGLANRDEFQSHLKMAIWQAGQRNLRCAVIYIDLDKFKPINDSYGHAVGDYVLRVTAQRLQQTIRETDVIARLGGDEFAVALFGLQHGDDAMALVDKLHRALEAPILYEGRDFALGASFGAAIYPDMATDAINLLKIADERMYAAKRAKHKDAPKLL